MPDRRPVEPLTHAFQRLTEMPVEVDIHHGSSSVRCQPVDITLDHGPIRHASS